MKLKNKTFLISLIMILLFNTYMELIVSSEENKELNTVVQITDEETVSTHVNVEEDVSDDEMDSEKKTDLKSDDINNNDESSQESEENATTEKDTNIIKPKVSYDVDGKETIEIEQEEASFHNIRVLIPKEVQQYEKVAIESTFDKRIDIEHMKLFVQNSTDKAQMTESEEVKTFSPKVDKQKVTLELREDEITNLVGKELTLQVETKINSVANEGDTIYQRATVRVNDEWIQESNLLKMKIIDSTHDTTVLNDEVSEDLTKSETSETQNDTTKINISQTYHNECKGKEPETCVEAYFTDEEMVHYVNVSISGEDTQLKDHIIKIEFPNEFIDPYYPNREAGGIRLTKPDLASDIEFKTEDGKRVAYIHFPLLEGGTDFSFPIFTKFNANGMTPEGYSLNISASIINSEKEEVKPANDIQFQAKYSELNVRKNIATGFSPSKLGIIDENGEWIEYWNEPIPFTFQMGHKDSPRRKFASYTITDTLPEGAVFDPDLEIDGKKVNEGWTLSEDKKTVSKTVSTNSSGAYMNEKEAILYLTFPNAQPNDQITNQAHIIGHQKDKKDYEPVYEGTDDVSLTIRGIESSRGAQFYKSNPYPYAFKDTLQDKQRTFPWTVGLKNEWKEQSIKNVVIDEYKQADGSYALDERMEFVSLTITNKITEGLSVIAYVEEADVVKEVPIAGEGADYSFPDHTKGFQIKIDELKPQEQIRFEVHSKLKEPEHVHYNEDDFRANFFDNVATYTGEVHLSEENTIHVKGEAKENYRILEAREAAFSSKQMTKSNVTEDDQLKIRLSPFQKPLSNTYYFADDTVFQNVQVIDLLPYGLEAVPGSGKMDTMNRQPLRYDKEFQIVENFKNSGRTAVIFEFDEVKPADMSLQIEFEAVVTNFSEPGENVNHMYVLFDGADHVELQNTVDDTYNLSDRKDGKILGDEAIYQYVPRKEVVSRKYIKTKQQENWSLIGTETEDGEAFEYKLTVHNTLDNVVNQLIVYDVLPYKDDQVIVANEEGVRLKRDSQFSNQLTGPLDVPDGFTVYYSTGPIIEDEVEAIKADHWQTASNVADFSQVTAFKIIMDDDRMLESEEMVEFHVPMKAPSDRELMTGDKAYNSFAISTNGGRSFQEANKVFNELVLPTLELTKVVAGEEEVTLQGAVFEIVACTDESIPYKDCEVVEQIETDEQGIARSDKVRKGIYKIKEVKAPKGFDLSDEEHLLIIDQSTTYNYTLSNQPETPILEKMITGKKPTTAIEQLKNKPYHYDLETTIPENVVGYENLTIRDQLNENLDIVGTKVFVDDEENTNLEVIVDEQLVTLTLDRQQLEKLSGKKLKLEITAKIKWNAPIEIINNQASIQVNDYPEVESNIVPVMPKDETIDITATKTWKDDEGSDRPNEIEVDLLRNGEVFQSAKIKADEDWTYTFKGLKKFDDTGSAYEYTLKEKPIGGYESTIEGYDITNVRVGTIDIPITKTWKDAKSTQRPTSITVRLYQNDKEIDAQEISAADHWTYTFTDLDAFDENGVAYQYTIKEDPIEGYETMINGYDITNIRVGKTEVSGKKTWKNDLPEDRPTSIKVDLLQNGLVIDTKEISATDDWSYSFSDLDQYDAEGMEYEYSIKEQDVPGYESEVDGFDLINTKIDEPFGPIEESPVEGNDLELADDESGQTESSVSDTIYSILPNTATHYYMLLFIGFLMAISGIGIWFIKRKRT